VQCTTFPWTFFTAAKFVRETRALAQAGQIDNPDVNLANDRVFVYNSWVDLYMTHYNGKLVVDFYRHFVHDADAIKFEDSILSSHGFVSL
jgi:hypothetical protein